MKLSRMCWLLVALILLTTTGTALTLKPTGPDWLVAGGDAGALSLEIGGGSGPFTISAMAATPLLCTVTPNTPFTSTSNKPPAFQVKPNITSGICQIDVKVMDVDGKTSTTQYFQNIDHTTPIYSGPDYPVTATVGTIVPVSIWLEDTFHNRVDNRNIAEYVTFYTGGRSGFVSGPAAKDSEPKLQSVSVPVNVNGYATVYYYVGEFETGNYIAAVSPPRAEPNPWIIGIYGALGGTPVSLVSQVSPDTGVNHWAYADGSSKFTVTYTVFDTRGFPVEAAVIKGSTSDGKSFTLVTNEVGQAGYDYGPKSSTGKYTITAALNNNPSVTVKDSLEFIAMGPDHLLATANPPSMPSLDVTTSSSSFITGRVSDQAGNPVKNEKVTFQITTVTSSKPLKAPPYLKENTKSIKYFQGSPVTVTTNADGNAVVTFIPGEFAKSITDPNYDPLANGTAIVTAKWGTKTETVTLTFQRTAYLFLETSVVNQTVKVGEYFDVTVNVTGDGKMIRKNPVEVMLVTDRSGSMTTALDGYDRFYWVQKASHEFLAQLNPAQDKVGLVTFGTWATRDAGLTSDFQFLNSTIGNVQIKKGWVPYKGPQEMTNIRDGLFNATSYLKYYGSKDKNITKAIVLLTDGGWNYGGTPLATGRGYAQRTRLVIWTPTYPPVDCGVGTPCYNTYYTGDVYWPGLPSTSMYTYYNKELYTYPDGTYAMDNPGSTIYTGEGRGPENRVILTGAGDTGGGYYCRPKIPLNQDNGPFWATFTCTRDEICNGPIGCQFDRDLYRIDVCDGTCSETEQNMAIYARNNNIRVYTITYAYKDFETSTNPGTKAVRDALQYISDTTGGKRYNAVNGSQLSDVYQDIATDLIKDASLKTDISANSSQVSELRTGDSLLGADVFDYVPLMGVSTITQKWDKDKKLIEGPSWSSSENEWNNFHKIDFNINSLKIGEKWQMKYRLKALKAGTYDVFGDDSYLDWTDWAGEDHSIKFPKTPVTVLPNGSATSNEILVLDKLRTEDEKGWATVINENTPFMLKWTLNYTSTNTQGLANLKVSIYSRDGQPYYERVDYKGNKEQLRPNNKEVELSMPWNGLNLGLYTAKVEAYGTLNSALPDYWDFEVGKGGDRSQIIIR